MPILLAPEPDLPLEQGDVLADVRTFLADAKEDPTEEVGIVLVVSRPCNALRDRYVIVAPVRKRPISDLRGAATPQDLVSFFKKARDGDGAPDSFYLGEIERDLRTDTSRSSRRCTRSSFHPKTFLVAHFWMPIGGFD